ncbi:MAG: succinate dehydrogenase hydrophobic membrane anchor subunit [Actinomycetota bacterium]
MATVEDIYRKHKPTAFEADRRPSSTEVWWWFFMRISGVVLVFLVLIHVYVMHVVGAGVERVDFAFVVERWDSIGWKSFDWIMLFLALLHGGNGVRIIIDDYIHRDGLRATIKGSLYALIVILMIMGTAVIVTFNPATAG